MRAGFVTCVQLGLDCIETIYESGGSLDCIVTLDDHIAKSKSGRIFLDAFATARGIPLHKTQGINQLSTVDYLRRADLDWLFIIGWSQIARPDVLNVARRGAIGMHPTLLPEGRGRAAIPWAILKGLERTGVSMFVLDAGVDTGPLLGQEVVPVDPNETATTLYAKVGEAHRALIKRLWPDLVDGSLRPQPQDDRQATIWPGRTPADGAIELTMTVSEVERLVRATTHPYPGAYIDLRDGRLRIWAGAKSDRAASAKGRVLALADGDYVATSFEVEPIPSVAGD